MFSDFCVQCLQNNPHRNFVRSELRLDVCVTMASEEDAVDEGIRSKAQSEGLRLRPYNAKRDDTHASYMLEYTQGFVSGET